tara:strand:- start:1933 stop:2592 length:660 start_codon:yes stop_codon:yes gene_type:complete
MKKQLQYFILLFSIIFSNSVFAEFSINKTGLLINTNDGEDIIIVENTGNTNILIYAEETEETEVLSGRSLFFVSPTLSELKPKEKQILRILIIEDDIPDQAIGRIRIQEIPDMENVNVKLSKSYNIPVVAHPSDLKVNNEPWKLLKVNKNKDSIILKNNSRYLIKIKPQIICDDKNYYTVSTPYINPKSQIEIKKVKKCDKIEIEPINNSGRILEKYKI